MESGDLYLRMGPRSRGDRCPLLLRSMSPNGDVQETAVAATTPKPLEGDDVVAAPAVGELAGHVSDYINSRRTANPSVIFGNVLLDLRAPDLYGLDWESATPMLFGAGRTVTRFHDVSDERLLVPFDLPARALQLECRPPAPAPTEGALQYFRTHKVAGLDNEDLLDTLQRGRYDIVHLVAHAHWCDDDAGAGLSIVHDTDLDRAVRQPSAPSMRKALLLGIGGASVLRISPLARQLARDVQRSAALLASLAQNAVFRHLAESPMSPVIPAGLSVDLVATKRRASDLLVQTDHYAHETGAMGFFAYFVVGTYLDSRAAAKPASSNTGGGANSWMGG